MPLSHSINNSNKTSNGKGKIMHDWIFISCKPYVVIEEKDNYED